MSKLFRMAKGVDRTQEPSGLGASSRAVADDMQGREIAGPDDRRDFHRQEDLILDLLGSVQGDGRTRCDAEEQSQLPVNDGGLLDALYVHYCRALETPDSLMDGAWVPTRLPMRVGVAEPASQAIPPIGENISGVISDMFSDIECIDQAFGPLRPGQIPDAVEHGVVPEVLRLFAPPEYKSKDRSYAIRPPALTQREHHTLAIDSPLPELGGAKREVDTGHS